MAQQLLRPLKSGWVVLVGAGAGHVLEALHDLSPKALACLVLLEPIEEIYNSKKLQKRFLSFLKDPRRIVSNPSELDTLIRSLSISDFQLYVLPAYRRVWPNLTDSLIQDITNAQKMESHIDRASQKKFIRIWTANTIRNCLSCETLTFLTTRPSPPIKNPLVYCGAAPSLPEDLARLGIFPSHPSSSCLISSDTALPFLLRQGYRPALCISVDASAASHWHFAMLEQIPGLSLPLKIPLLTWLPGPSYYKNYFQKTIFYRSSFPLDQIMGEGPLHHIPEWKNPSRNVAGLSLLLAHALGAKSLYLAGSAFTSQNGKSHVPGTGYELYALAAQNKLNGLSVYQTQNYQQARSKNQQAKKGITELANTLGMRIVWPPGFAVDTSSFSSPSQDSLPGSVATDSTQALFEALDLLCAPIKSQSIQSYLLDFFEQCNEVKWQSVSLPNDWLPKGRQILAKHP